MDLDAQLDALRSQGLVDDLVEEEAITWLIDQDDDERIDLLVQRFRDFSTLATCPDLHDKTNRFPKAHTADVHTGETPLLKAVKCADIHRVKRLIQLGAECDWADYAGVTPLHAACQAGNESCALALIDAGARLDAAGGHRVESPLHAAAGSGNASLVSALIARGADVRATDSDGRTVIGAAAAAGKVESIHVLLEAHIDIHEEAAPGGATPIHIAAQYGQVRFVEALLAAGVDVDVIDAAGETPLHATSKYRPELNGDGCNASNVGSLNHDVLNILNSDALHASDGDVRKVDTLELESLDGEAKKHEAPNGDPVTAAQILLQHRADPNTCDHSGRTPLHASLESGQFHLANFLLSNGAHAHLALHNGATPLWMARELELVTSLPPPVELEGVAQQEVAASTSEPDIDLDQAEIREVHGQTSAQVEDLFPMPPRRGSSSGSIDEGLLSSSSEGDVDCASSYNFLASRSDNERPRRPSTDAEVSCAASAALKMAAVTISAALDEAMAAAAAARDPLLPPWGALLLDYVDIDAPTELGWTPLYMCAQEGRLGDVGWLLSEGASVDAPCADGSTPLQAASASGRVAVALALLAHGASPSVCTGEFGAPPPLHLLCGATNLARGTITIAAGLVHAGADISGRDADGATPLLVLARAAVTSKACTHDQDTRVRLASLLLHSGATARASDGRGRSTVWYAAFTGEAPMLELLLADAGGAAAADVGDSEGATPLYAATARGHASCVRLLTDARADASGAAMNGCPPICLAASRGDSATLQQLLDEGALIEGADENGATALIHAASKGHQLCVNLLLTNGASVNASDANGLTPFHAAFSQAHSSTADILRAAGADISRRTNGISFLSDPAVPCVFRNSDATSCVHYYPPPSFEPSSHAKTHLGASLAYERLRMRTAAPRAPWVPTTDLTPHTGDAPAETPNTAVNEMPRDWELQGEAALQGEQEQGEARPKEAAQPMEIHAEIVRPEFVPEEDTAAQEAPTKPLRRPRASREELAKRREELAARRSALEAERAALGL